MPTAWQRYQSLAFAATTREHPYGCSTINDCSGFVAGGYAARPAYWAAREHAFRKSKGWNCDRLRDSRAIVFTALQRS